MESAEFDCVNGVCGSRALDCGKLSFHYPSLRIMTGDFEYTMPLITWGKEGFDGREEGCTLLFKKAESSNGVGGITLGLPFLTQFTVVFSGEDKKISIAPSIYASNGVTDGHGRKIGEETTDPNPGPGIALFFTLIVLILFCVTACCCYVRKKNKQQDKRNLEIIDEYYERKNRGESMSSDEEEAKEEQTDFLGEFRGKLIHPPKDQRGPTVNSTVVSAASSERGN